MPLAHVLYIKTRQRYKTVDGEHSIKSSCFFYVLSDTTCLLEQEIFFCFFLSFWGDQPSTYGWGRSVNWYKCGLLYILQLNFSQFDCSMCANFHISNTIYCLGIFSAFHCKILYSSFFLYENVWAIHRIYNIFVCVEYALNMAANILFKVQTSVD